MDLAAYCLKNKLKIKKSPPPPYKRASFMRKKKKNHFSTTEQEMKNSFITEMMWEILYVGNTQFLKIEAGQDWFNYLGINIVAFFTYPNGQ